MCNASTADNDIIAKSGEDVRAADMRYLCARTSGALMLTNCSQRSAKGGVEEWNVLWAESV